ncbi:MAG TPA: response regulator [Candidatus Saccharimonadales bacterium]|nr:response regulator [Candidatus Saccharimonadales bacterium]
MTDVQKKVLIVEDEKPLAHALQLKLEHEGFIVTSASDGQECLNLLQQQPFDVILLDLIMPVMDGFQVLERLKGLSQAPAVFVLSNLSQQEDEQRVLQLGARKFFIKSDTPLTTIVEEVKKV